MISPLLVSLEVLLSLAHFVLVYQYNNLEVLGSLNVPDVLDVLALASTSKIRNKLSHVNRKYNF